MQSILQQILYFFGHGLCHQYPERSFEAGGLYFGVCARDTGIYLGFAFTLVVLLVLYARVKDNPAALPPAWAVVVSIVIILPMAVDGASSYLGLRETNNLLRYSSGYLCGTGVAVLASAGMFSLWTRANHDLSAVSRPGRLSTVLVASAAAGAAFYAIYPFLGVGAPLLAFAAQWLAFTLVVALVLSTTSFWPRQLATDQLGTVDWQGAIGQSGSENRQGAAAPPATPTQHTASHERVMSSRVLVFLFCIVVAGLVMAVLSFAASGLHLLFPWYVHP
jgi:uncharacterized membrane protein